MDLIASTDREEHIRSTVISENERKRREAVWELFQSECVFLIDHLMVLKHVRRPNTLTNIIYISELYQLITPTKLDIICIAYPGLS